MADSALDRANTQTSLKYLKAATRYSDLSLPPQNQWCTCAPYLKQHKSTILLLQQATKLPPVDFSRYHDSNMLLPKDIGFINGLSECIRLLMLDFTYAVNTKQESRAKSALVTALKTNSLIAGVPLLYAQLCRTGIISIIFERIQDTVDLTGNGLEIFNDATIQNFCVLLKQQEKESLAGYQNSLLNESQIPNSELGNYFKVHTVPGLKINDYTALTKQYRALCKLCAESLDQPSNKVWLQISNEANAFNRHFKTKMITPIDWKYNYLKTISDLRILRIVFEAVKFKNRHGTFPHSQEQFVPEDIRKNGFISFYYTGTRDTFKVTSSVKNSSFEYRKRKPETQSLENKDQTLSPFGVPVPFNK